MYGFKHERIDKSIKFSNGKVYINGIEGFWSFAKERLLKFPGVSREYFVYYFKELHNLQIQDFCEKILELIYLTGSHKCLLILPKPLLRAASNLECLNFWMRFFPN